MSPIPLRKENLSMPSTSAEGHRIARQLVDTHEDPKRQKTVLNAYELRRGRLRATEGPEAEEALVAQVFGGLITIAVGAIHVCADATGLSVDETRSNLLTAIAEQAG
jgi:hypothetical protein